MNALPGLPSGRAPAHMNTAVGTAHDGDVDDITFELDFERKHPADSRRAMTSTTSDADRAGTSAGVGPNQEEQS